MSAAENFQFLSGVSRPLQKAALLLFFGEMQEEFDDGDSVPREIALEGADVLVTLLPDVLGDELLGETLVGQRLGMHAHDQHFFIVRTVEDPDAATGRSLLAGAPQIAVAEFLGRGHFE